MSAIAETGYWQDDSEEHHVFDDRLAAELVGFFRPKSVLDLGCGPGRYVACLRQAGVECDGYDGNPHTEALSAGVCKVLDLSAPVDLGRVYDRVLSLEVGEHIPCEYENVFLENIVRHAREGVVVSWGVPGQPGHGHVNTRENRYIKAFFASRGFVNDLVREQAFREGSSCLWFKDTLMVFRRGGNGTNAGKIVPPGATPHAALPPATGSGDEAWREDVEERLKELERKLDDAYWLVLMQRIREVIQATVPAGAVVLVVGECDDELMLLPGRRARPFPQTAEGEYAGWYPVHGADAVTQLKELRDRGAEYVLFPATSHWWIEHYQDLARFLETECRPIFRASSTCSVFALRGAV